MDPAFRADAMPAHGPHGARLTDVLERLIKGLFARRTEAPSRDYVSADGTKFLTEDHEEV